MFPTRGGRSHGPYRRRRVKAVTQDERLRFRTWCGVVLALTLSAVMCDQTRAQNPNTTQLQKETQDLNAQLDALEGKINLNKASAPQLPASDKSSQPQQPPSARDAQPQDSKLHLGGITITPGGFLELDGMARQRGQ
jgi:hypothetical protein